MAQATAAQRPQRDESPVIQDFHHWIWEASCLGTLANAAEVNCPFIPLPEVVNYFKDRRRVKKLLSVLFAADELPIDPDVVRTRCPRVFCILLLLKKGHFIERFCTYEGLRDHKLPFLECPRDFPIATDDSDFWPKFYKKQWFFCAPEMSYMECDVSLEKECILPIIRKEKLAGGGSAFIYKITIHEAYNRLHQSTSSTQGSPDQHPDTFVLKTYRTRDAERYYRNEVDAYRRLTSHGSPVPYMIRFYGSFKQDQSYNVLLEYADRGNLEQYFGTVDPPTKGEDIMKFWSALFNLNQALIIIHGQEPSTHDGPQILAGWHQDIKPENILVTNSGDGSNYDCCFKLADMGLSHFRRTVMHSEVADVDSYGTRAYGAPECYRGDDFLQRCHLKVLQKVDIWSLGCVYSEAATWLLTGYEGLLYYRRKRKAEVDQIPNFRDGNCFHNGETVLNSVRLMHEHLQKLVSYDDHITYSVITRMIADMLETSDPRPTAMQAWTWSQRILAEAAGSLQRTSPVGSFSQSLRPQTHRRSLPVQWCAGSMHTSGGHPGSSRFFSEPEEYLSGPQSHRGWGGPSSSASTHISMANGAANTMNDTQIDPESEFLRRGLSNQFTRNRMSGAGHSVNFQMGQSAEQDPFIEDPPSQLTSSNTPDTKQKRRAKFGFFSGRAHVGLVSSLIGSPESHRRNGSGDSVRRKSLTPQSSPTNILCDTGSSHRPSSSLSPGYSSAQPFPSLDAKYQSPPPNLGVANARRWKVQRKRGHANVQLPESYLLERLGGRDHFFLIDNSASMAFHWDKVRDLFEVLSYMLKSKDPNGLDLMFTVSDGQIYNSSRTTPLCDIVARGYSSEMVRPLNVYILTDGVWQPQCDAKPPIQFIVKKLEEHMSPEDQIGLQFISFGDNREGLLRLQYLDSGLGLARDIVDTEPYEDGNVWKMLLGATDRWFDMQRELHTAM